MPIEIAKRQRTMTLVKGGIFNTPGQGLGGVQPWGFQRACVLAKDPPPQPSPTGGEGEKLVTAWQCTAIFNGIVLCLK